MITWACHVDWRNKLLLILYLLFIYTVYDVIFTLCVNLREWYSSVRLFILTIIQIICLIQISSSSTQIYFLCQRQPWTWEWEQVFIDTLLIIALITVCILLIDSNFIVAAAVFITTSRMRFTHTNLARSSLDTKIRWSSIIISINIDSSGCSCILFTIHTKMIKIAAEFLWN